MAIFDDILNEMAVRGHDNETIEEINYQISEYTRWSSGTSDITVTRFMPRNVFGHDSIVIGR